MVDSPRVLVVDDELHLCSAVDRILTKQGYSVTTASNGEAALELIKDNQPDVVLLDLMMPGMDGREVCRWLRQSTDGTQVIYFTARADPIDSQTHRELRAEADALLAKPATSRQILSSVDRVLRNAPRELQPVA